MSGNNLQIQKNGSLFVPLLVLIKESILFHDLIGFSLLSIKKQRSSETV